MADDQQQPGQPPAGAPGSWPPPTPNQPGYAPPPADAPAGWSPQGQAGWGQPQQPPAWGQQPAQQPWGQAQQPPQQPWGQQPAPGAYPPPGGYPQPPYGAPAGYPPPAFGYGPRYAGFWIRFVAYIIDIFIYGFAILVAAISLIVLIGIVLLPLVIFGYFPFLWWKRGATFGQSLLGLRVVRAIDGGPIDGGMAAIRALVYYAELFFGSWGIGLIGFAWAAFEPRKRAWHDMAAGTVVIHVD